MELWKEDSGIPLPAANSYFPKLVNSIFDLEKDIIENQLSIPMADGMVKSGTIQRRSSSTHCAVNRVSTRVCVLNYCNLSREMHVPVLLIN